MVGTSEAALQYALGGISKLGGVSTEQLLTKVAGIDNAIWRVAAKIGSEVTEEELQLFLEPLYRTLVFGEDYSAPALEEILYTALLTVTTTGILEGGDIASYSDKDIKALVEQSKEQIKEDGVKALQSGEMPDDAHLEIMKLNAAQYAANADGDVAEQQGTFSGKLDGLTVAERQMVDDLLNLGNNVEIIPRSNIQRDKTPDFLVDGVKTELKTLNGTSINTPISKIQKGFKQGAEVVIIDGRYTEISLQDAERILERAAGTYGGKFPGKVEFWTKEGIIRR